MQIQQEHVDRLASVLDKLEADYLERDEAFIAQSKTKELMVRSLIFVIVLVALVNIYFVNYLREEVSAMTEAMVEMNSHFGSVSKRMDNLTGTVSHMRQWVRMLPIVSAQMDEIAGLVENIDGDVEGIQGVMYDTNRRIGNMGMDMQDMSIRFRGLNGIVGGMGRDVEQMALPIP
jgi:hypothetical protein